MSKATVIPNVVLKGNILWYQKKVPTDLRGILAKSNYLVSLETADLAVARQNLKTWQEHFEC